MFDDDIIDDYSFSLEQWNYDEDVRLRVASNTQLDTTHELPTDKAERGAG